MKTIEEWRDDHDLPDPPQRALYEAYHRRFGEWPPTFAAPTEDMVIRLVKRALRTGERITLEDLSPGAVAQSASSDDRRAYWVWQPGDIKVSDPV